VVITNVLTHQAFQMALVQDDHMIEQIVAGGWPTLKFLGSGCGTMWGAPS